MYTIDANITGSGVTDPVLPQSVAEGENLEVLFNSNAGWEVSEVIIDGNSLGAIASFEFEEVYSDYDIDVVFTEIPSTTHDIAVQDNIAGIISPGGIVAVVEGQDQVFNLAVSTGYTQTAWVVDDVDVPAATTYTFTNVTAPHTIGAKFERDITYNPRVKLLQSEEFTIKRRNFEEGDYDTKGYREQGPLYQSFKVLGNKQPGQTQSGLLQAVGEQIRQEEDYGFVNKSWKVFTYDELRVKDSIVLEDGDYEILDVDEWASYNGLRSLNYRSMARQIKSRD